MKNSVPEEADNLIKKVSALIPKFKITGLLMEVDRWADFSRHFTHLKGGQPASDRVILMTAVLADGINLGLTNGIVMPFKTLLATGMAYRGRYLQRSPGRAG